MTLAITGSEGPVGAAIHAALAAEGLAIGRIPASALASRTLADAALTRFAGNTAPSMPSSTHTSRAPCCSPAPSRTTDDEWDARCEAPLRATINLLEAAHGHLRDRGGVIIVVLPTAGLAGQRQFAACAAAREGQRTLVKATARAWLPEHPRPLHRRRTGTVRRRSGCAGFGCQHAFATVLARAVQRHAARRHDGDAALAAVQRRGRPHRHDHGHRCRKVDAAMTQDVSIPGNIDCSGRRILLTGAGAGLGRAMALSLAAAAQTWCARCAGWTPARTWCTTSSSAADAHRG